MATPEPIAPPEGFTLDDQFPTKPTEASLRPVVAMSPEEQSYGERNPYNDVMLQQEIARTKDPKARAVLEQERTKRQQDASVLPAGFVLDDQLTTESAAPRKTMYEVLTGPNLTAQESKSATPPVSTAEYIANQAKKGLMSMPGLPGTVISALPRQKPPESLIGRAVQVGAELNPVSMLQNIIQRQQAQQRPGETPFMSGDYLAEKILGAKEMRPPSKGAEFVGDIAEFMASMPFGPVKALAQKGAPAAVKELAKLGAVSTGAVAGGELGQAAFGEGPTAKTAGELATIPFMAVGSKWASLLTKEGRQLAKDTASSIVSDTRGGVGAMVNQAVQNRLAKGIQDYREEAILNIREAGDLQAKINAAISDPQAKLTLSPGRMTGAPAVVADEFAARRSSATNVAESIKEEKRNTAAILSYMAPEVKTAASRKAAIDREIATYNSERQRLVNEADAVKRQASRLTTATVPSMTAQERGAKLIEQRAAVKTKEDQVKNGLFAAAQSEANRVGAEFSSDAIQLKARELSANPILAYDENNLPLVIRNIRAMTAGGEGEVAPSLMERGLAAPVASVAAEAAPKPLAFKDITALREAVNQDISLEMRSTNPNKRQRLRALTEMKSTVDGAIAESEHEGVRKLYGAATDYYRDTYSPMFNKGINAKLAMTDSLGEQRVFDEKILDQYAASTTNIDRFLKLFGKNPEALAVMEDHLLDRFGKATIKDGQIDGRAYQMWIKKNGDVLRKLDQAGLKSMGRFNNIASKTQELSDKQRVLIETEESMNKSELAKLLGLNTDESAVKKVLKDPITPKIEKLSGFSHHLIVQKAMSDPAAMGRLTNALGQPGSKALMSSVMRELMSKITYPPEANQIGINHTELSKWLNQNSTTASILFKRALGEKEGAEHLQRLKDSSRMFSIMERVKTPEAAAADTSIGRDPLIGKVGVGFRTFFNMMRAVVAGRTSEADMAVTLGGQSGSFFFIKAYNKLMQSVATDPESSKYLMTLAKTGTKPVLTKQESIEKAKAISGLIGKLGYYWLGGRYYGPSLKTLAPVMVQEQMKGMQNASNQER